MITTKTMKQLRRHEALRTMRSCSLATHPDNQRDLDNSHIEGAIARAAVSDRRRLWLNSLWLKPRGTRLKRQVEQ